MSQPTLKQLAVIDLVPFGNTGVDTAFFALRLSPPGWENWRPGQFVMVRPAGVDSTILWARPFAICRATSRDLTVFFQVRGRATAVLSRLQPEDVLDVWGPLGNSFVMEARKPSLLLAGGIGIAPFVGYVHMHPTPWEITMEFGHRAPLDCYPFDNIDGKATLHSHQEKAPGDREAFLAIVESRIREFGEKDGLVLACGPTPFLRAVQAYANACRVRAQVCLETRMACGVGACLGCVVKATLPSASQPGAGAASGADSGTGRQYLQTCMRGPNFWTDNVILD